MGRAMAYCRLRGARHAGRPRSRAHPHDLRQHSRHDRDAPPSSASAARTHPRHAVRQVRVLQPALLGQGSPGDRADRGCRERSGPSSPGRRWSRPPPAIPAWRSPWCARRKGYPLVARHGRVVLRRAPPASCACSAPRSSSRPPRSAAAAWCARPQASPEKHGWFLARQFENEANPAYHRNTTGPEILSDFAGKRLDYFVTGWGTGGTLTGAGEMIRLAAPGAPDHRRASRPTRALLAASPGRRTRSRAGRRTSCRGPQSRGRRIRSSPVTDAEAIEEARALATRRASSAASPPVPRSPRRSRSPRGARARSSSRCFRTPASVSSSTLLFEGIPEAGDPEP